MIMPCQFMPLVAALLSCNSRQSITQQCQAGRHCSHAALISSHATVECHVERHSLCTTVVQL